MKIRFVALGKGKLDKWGFSFQYEKNIGVFYTRIGLFAIMLSLYGYDPVADLQRKIAQDKSTPISFNRHQRRAMEKLARKHAQA